MSQSFYIALIEEDSGREINVGHWPLLPHPGTKITCKGKYWVVLRVASLGAQHQVFVEFFGKDKRAKPTKADEIRKKIKELTLELKALERKK